MTPSCAGHGGCRYLGIYGQRAFRRNLDASTVVFPAGPAGIQNR